MRKLILFLIRIRLGVRKHEPFTFVGQKSDTFYVFDDHVLYKFWRNKNKSEESHVSLNWILNENCKVVKLHGEYGKD